MPWLSWPRRLASTRWPATIAASSSLLPAAAKTRCTISVRREWSISGIGASRSVVLEGDGFRVAQPIIHPNATRTGIHRLDSAGDSGRVSRLFAHRDAQRVGRVDAEDHYLVRDE